VHWLHKNPQKWGLRGCGNDGKFAAGNKKKHKMDKRLTCWSATGFVTLFFVAVFGAECGMWIAKKMNQ
jgi:hypothetical protein